MLFEFNISNKGASAAANQLYIKTTSRKDPDADANRQRVNGTDKQNKHTTYLQGLCTKQYLPTTCVFSGLVSLCVCVLHLTVPVSCVCVCACRCSGTHRLPLHSSRRRETLPIQPRVEPQDRKHLRLLPMCTGRDLSKKKRVSYKKIRFSSTVQKLGFLLSCADAGETDSS